VSQEVSLRAKYAAIVRRRKWVVLLTLIIVPVVAVLVSLHEQRPRYRATAQLLINTQSPTARFVAGPGDIEDPARVAQTQAGLARGQAIARAALARVGLQDRRADDLLRASSVTADPNDDLLDFQVKDAKPSVAARLATAYAQEFARYRNELDSRQLVDLQRRTEQRLTAIRANGDVSSPLYAALTTRARQLALLEAVQTVDYVVTNPAEGAVQVSPRPVRSGLIGLIAGALLAVGLVLLSEAWDKNLYSAEQIRGVLGDLPLLASLPTPARRDRSDPLVMASRPTSDAAERFRVLQTNLRFANIELGAKTILFTSALKQEGKSTTVANTAVALARAGNRVALLDLDFRHPRLQQLFGVDGGTGITQVVLKQAVLEDVRQSIPLTSTVERTASGAGTRLPFGTLDLYGSGPTLADAGEFVARPEVDTIPRTLALFYDLVLIDAPPLLGVSDAIVLGAKVDALVVVARLRTLNLDALEDLAAVLDLASAAKLGLVVTAADLDAAGWDDYQRGYDESVRPQRRRGREAPLQGAT
jgi:tyrosine-protein kinase